MNVNDVNWDAVRFGFDLGQLIFMAGVAIYLWWTNRSRATKASIEEVDKKIDRDIGLVEDTIHMVSEKFDRRTNELERRVDSLEKDLSHLPGHSEMAAVHEKVNSVANTMSAMQGELSSMSRNLNLIHEFLLNKGNDK
jgi:predicted  nucleic acid-binding Zn-ribbon protein